MNCEVDKLKVDKIKVVIFGDSITAGWIDERPHSILRKETQERLAQKGVLARVVLHGIPAEDTNDAMKRLGIVAKERADYTVIFFGANDAANYHLITPEEYAENLTTFVQKFGSDKAILLTPPYHNDENGDLNRNNDFIEPYRQQAIKVARTLDVPLIDIFQEMIDTGHANELLQEDCLHFSYKGYAFLGEVIAKKVKELNTNGNESIF